MTEPKRISIGREKAIELNESKWWELCDSDREIVEFQLFTEQLCMPLDAYRKSLNKTLGRQVFCHEIYGDWSGVAAEFLGEREAPTLDEIIGMIPAEKRIIISG